MMSLMCCALVIGMTSGCSKKREPRFYESERAISLMPEVRSAVASQLTEMFGTLHAPQAPSWLPIERGGTTVTIEEVKQKDEQGKIVSFTLKTGESAPEIKAGDLIEVILDPEEVLDATLDAAENGEPSPAFPATVPVASVDQATGVITLAEPLCKMAEQGSDYVINPNKNLVEGQRLYALHCSKCHADTGDGGGPQSVILFPSPRDFRLGITKYTSTKPNIKASSDDLHQLMKKGIAGTGMPAFQLLGNHEIDTLVEYTKYLSMRGEVERGLCVESEIDFAQSILDEELEGVESEEERKEITAEIRESALDFLKSDFLEIVLDVSLDVGESWEKADDPENILEPKTKRTAPLGPSKADSSVSSLVNGRRLYMSTSTQCASCHGDLGAGDGEQTKKIQKRPDGGDYEEVGLHDAWGIPVTPRNLNYGIFRGGREPVDLFRRIYVGVKGTPMPVYGGKGLTEEQIWDLVNYMFFLAGDFPEVTPESLETPAAEEKTEEAAKKSK